jgi:hypothetical protein
MTHYQTMLDHLVTMASNPGWIDHARLRCKQLEQTEMYAGISQDVAQRLKSLRGSECSKPATKPLGR